MARPFLRFWFWVLPGVFLAPGPALALQTHGPPEGLYVHQIAHILFAAALLFLIWALKQEGMARVSGFRYLIWACSLFILWNLVAFAGHWAEVLLNPQDFLGEAGGLSRRLVMSGAASWVYFLAKLDHLILLPAFFFLACGLKFLIPALPGVKK
jgi:hypothetical protein